jgi:hypothetical protein
MRGAQALGMTGPARGDPRQGLAERAARAGVIDASKAPDLHAQDDRATRQITEAAPVMTLSIQLRRAAISPPCSTSIRLKRFVNSFRIDAGCRDYLIKVALLAKLDGMSFCQKSRDLGRSLGYMQNSVQMPVGAADRNRLDRDAVRRDRRRRPLDPGLRKNKVAR